MDRENKLENESIQQGLEGFLDREMLDLTLAQNQGTGQEKQKAKPKEVELLYGSEASLVKNPKIVKTTEHLGEERLTEEEWRRREAKRLREEERRKEEKRLREQERRREEKRRQEQNRGRSTRIWEDDEDDDEDDGIVLSFFGDKKQKPKKSREKEYEEYSGKVKKQKGKQGKKLSKKEQAKLKKKREKEDKKKTFLAKFLAVVVFLVIVFFLLYRVFIGSVYKKMTYEPLDEFTKESMKEDGVTNVLLIGNDSRKDGEDGRSDAMILLSINDKKKKIIMTSFLRDTYVSIPGHEDNRLNAAYSFGGAALLMETIEQNFDIPVHRYCLVNFQAFANLVDAVGGVDLEVSNEEVQLINGYLMEYNQLRDMPLDTDFLDTNASGMLHLNGPQALAYTRNRYIGTDFGRTERQRKVLSAIFKKAPAKVLTNGNEMMNGILPNLTTNLTESETSLMGLKAAMLAGYDLEQQHVPMDGTYQDATIRGMAVLQVDLEANKQMLKNTIYNQQ